MVVCLFVFICLGYFLSSSSNAHPRDMQNSQTILKLLIDSGLKFWTAMANYLLMQCHTLQVSLRKRDHQDCALESIGFLAWYCLQVTTFLCSKPQFTHKYRCWQLPIWEHIADKSFSGLSSLTLVVLYEDFIFCDSSSPCSL